MSGDLVSGWLVLKQLSCKPRISWVNEGPSPMLRHLRLRPRWWARSQKFGGTQGSHSHAQRSRAKMVSVAQIVPLWICERAVVMLDEELMKGIFHSTSCVLL